MDCGSAVNWLVAAGTLGSALTALWIGVFRPRRRRPSLTLHYDPANPSDAQVAGIKFGSRPPESKYNTRGAFARLRVRNQPRKETAFDVEVLVEEVRVGDLDPAAIREGLALGDLALPASNSLPTTTRLNIAPGVGRHFDLVHIRKREVEERGGYADLILAVYPEPADLRHRISAAGVEVDLVVAARNADAVRYTVAIEWDFEWPAHEGEVFKHLRVSEPRRR